MHIFGAAILNSTRWRKASGSADPRQEEEGCSFSPSKKEKSPLPVQNVAFSSVKLNFRQQQKGQNEWVLRSTLKRRKQPREVNIKKKEATKNLPGQRHQSTYINSSNSMDKRLQLSWLCHCIERNRHQSTKRTCGDHSGKWRMYFCKKLFQSNSN